MHTQGTDPLTVTVDVPTPGHAPHVLLHSYSAVTTLMGMAFQSTAFVGDYGCDGPFPRIEVVFSTPLLLAPGQYWIGLGSNMPESYIGTIPLGSATTGVCHSSCAGMIRTRKFPAFSGPFV